MFNTRRTRPAFPILSLLVALAAPVVAPGAASAGDQPVETPTGGFRVEQETVVPISPLAAYDAMTGDISGWWDHSMSETPHALYIEAKPGGGFYEIFDESGDGARHGTVIYAERGKRLTFEGPLGFSGHALDLVVTYEFTPEGDGTRIKVVCNGEGQVEEGWPEAVNGVWAHFLIERFKPYVESGDYLKKK